MITLGKKVRDKISDFKGIAVARTVWLSGCIRIAIQPKVKRTGEWIQEEWFDEDYVQYISEDEKEIKQRPPRLGGSRERPPRSRIPR